MIALESWLWIGFAILITLFLGLDLGVLNRRPHAQSLREAGGWTCVWVATSAAFALAILVLIGSAESLEFVTAYLIEESLSVDNIFVFVLLFEYFRVPAEYQHRVLFWGILGALIARGVMIWGGIALLGQFAWLTYLFGAFLVYTGVRLAVAGPESEADVGKNPVLRVLRAAIPISRNYDGHRFFTRSSAATGYRLLATPLLAVLVMVEMSDLIFALDSVPAVLSITRDPVIAYTSNVFAILGLRSLYFLLAHVIERFHYLRSGIAAVLTFVGLEMLAEDFVHISTGLSLLVIVGLVSISIVLSLLFPRPVEGSAFESLDESHLNHSSDAGLPS